MIEQSFSGTLKDVVRNIDVSLKGGAIQNLPVQPIANQTYEAVFRFERIISNVDGGISAELRPELCRYQVSIVQVAMGIIGNTPVHHYEALSQTFMTHSIFFRNNAGQWQGIATDYENATKDLLPIEIMLLDIRAFAVNFGESAAKLMEEFTKRAQMLADQQAIPSEPIPSSVPESMPDGTPSPTSKKGSSRATRQATPK